MRSITTIAPIILAAGDSARMGYPKALLPIGTDTFLTRILGVLRDAGTQPATVILGKAASVIQESIRDWPANIYINQDPGRGQLSSIQLALSHLSGKFTAAMIWPVDQPAISVDLVRNLVQVFITSGSQIACPVFGNRRGHPAIFHQTLFQEFMDAPLEHGPKGIILRHQDSISTVVTEEPASVEDIDTPSQYHKLTGVPLDFALKDASVPD
jgi:molybdenum cofactor cytidylyltransferase